MFKGVLNKVALPSPGKIPFVINKPVKVLLLNDAINNLSRRIENDLLSHEVTCKSIETSCPEQMTRAVSSYQPDVIVCPFLKSKVPEIIFTNKERPCLIVHPGIAGDRGASSIDWALYDDRNQWGVTVLQAHEEMDAGDIWSTETFDVPPKSTKTSLYNGGVADSAVRCVQDAVSRFCQNIKPTLLDANHPEIKGELRRNMKTTDRMIDWKMPSMEIEKRIRMSDTVPGALCELNILDKVSKYRLFDAHVETGEQSHKVRELLKSAFPGKVVAVRNKSVLVKAGDKNGVWIGQMKKNNKAPTLKLPSMELLNSNHDLHLQDITDFCCHDDVRLEIRGSVCYVHFDFYNGAMDKEQAARLHKTLLNIASLDDIKVVAMMGGDRFFSTGIHLCVIENSNYKQLESWANINAIDDVIKSIVMTKDKVFVAVLQGNAGAGGAMMAAACDVVVAHPGVMLTPTYKAMHLYGSEYWTYFLPKRVGHGTAAKLVSDTNPISARYAESIGLVDQVFGRNKASFKEKVPEFLQKLVKDGHVKDIIRDKRLRDSDFDHLLQTHRNYELSQMRRNFLSAEFLTAMHNFVYKLP